MGAQGFQFVDFSVEMDFRLDFCRHLAFDQMWHNSNLKSTRQAPTLPPPQNRESLNSVNYSHAMVSQDFWGLTGAGQRQWNAKASCRQCEDSFQLASLQAFLPSPSLTHIPQRSAGQANVPNVFLEGGTEDRLR